MKKEIRISTINGVAKKAALGAMLASSAAMFASNPIKTARTDNPPQTEVVSKDGAEALKVMTFPQQQTPAVPTVHNKALDEKFLKLARDDEEKKFMEGYLSNIYNNCGSYLASAKIQQNIDLNMFLEFLDGNLDLLKEFGPITIDGETFGKDYYEMAVKLNTPERQQEIENLRNNVYEWISQNYFNIYSGAFNFDHKPNYEEVLASMDDFVENNTLEFAPGKRMFYKGEGYRAREQKELDRITPQDVVRKNTGLEMDYIASRMYLLDYDLFMNMLKLFDTSHETFKIFKNLYGNSTSAEKSICLLI